MSVLAPPRGPQRIYSVNPVAKIAAVLPLTICLLLTLDWASATTAVLGELALFLGVGLRSRAVWLRTLPVWVGAPLAGASMVLYGAPSGTTYWQVGLIHVTSGSVAIGLATAARLVAIALPAVVLLATIDPTDLADGLAQIARLPSRFVLGALAGLRLVGLLTADWRSLELARRARGVGDSGRVRRLLGQGMALLVLSIRRGSKLATAMEARGFGGPTRRSWARPSSFGWAEWVTIAVGVALGAVAVGVAVISGHWNLVLAR